MPDFDADDDMRDGILFRLWVRVASYPGGWPSRLSQLIQEETTAEGRATPAAYRRALMRLADEKGVNLP
ncbi:MAG: hypothetical protein WA975_18020 [Mesorhizobium sp.]